jgi:hypothetical protein
MNKLLLISLLAITTSSVFAGPKISNITQPDRREVAGSMILNAEGIELIYPETQVLDTVLITPVPQEQPITGVELDQEDLRN